MLDALTNTMLGLLFCNIFKNSSTEEVKSVTPNANDFANANAPLMSNVNKKYPKR